MSPRSTTKISTKTESRVMGSIVPVQSAALGNQRATKNTDSLFSVAYQAPFLQKGLTISPFEPKSKSCNFILSILPCPLQENVAIRFYIYKQELGYSKESSVFLFLFKKFRMIFLTLIQIAAITCTSVHGLPVENAYDNNKLHSLVDYLRDNNAYLSFEKRDADFGAHRNVNYNEQKLDDFLFPEEDEEKFTMPKMDISSKQEKVMPEAKISPGVLSRLQEMVPNPLSWFNATSISKNVQSYKKPVYEYAKNAFKKLWGPVDKEVLKSQQMVEDERAQAELKRTLQDILAGKKMRTDIRNHLMTLARKVYTSNSFDLSAEPQDERAMHYKLEREVVEKLSDLAIAQLNADFSGTPTTGRSG